MTLGQLLDRLWKKKEEIEKAEAKVRELKAAYDGIEDEIFKAFRKSDLEKATGRVAQASLSKLVHPKVKDWESFERFVYRNKALDLLQRRVGKKNWLDRLDARGGRPIPGIETFEQTKLNLRKRS